MYYKAAAIYLGCQILSNIKRVLQPFWVALNTSIVYSRPLKFSREKALRPQNAFSLPQEVPFKFGWDTILWKLPFPSCVLCCQQIYWHHVKIITEHKHSNLNPGLNYHQSRSSTRYKLNPMKTDSPGWWVTETEIGHTLSGKLPLHIHYMAQ